MDSVYLKDKNIDAAKYFSTTARIGIDKYFRDNFGLSIKSENWKERTIYGFAEQIFFEYDELNKCYNSSSTLSSVAFHTRNLLELMIWVIHCLENENNLRDFFEDAAKDARELFDSFQQWTLDWDSNFGSDDIDSARNQLKQSANNQGISNIEGKYKSVANIADKYPKLKSYYKLSNKILSKCAHPTSLTIVGIPDEATKTLKDTFFGLGCLYFCASIRPIGINIGLTLADPLEQGTKNWWTL